MSHARVRATLAPLAAVLLAASLGRAASNFAGGRLTADWARTSKEATVRGGNLLLDALRTDQPVAVFRKDEAFIDTRLGARFRIQRVGKGDRTFGLLFGSTSGQRYFALEIDRDEMRLVRVEPGKPPHTLTRRGVRDHTGQFATARVECQGTLCRAYYDDQTLTVRHLKGLKAGRVGAYARGGRVEVSAINFGGTPARLPRAWQLRPQPEDKQPSTAAPPTKAEADN
ncbi:MAG: hypothetical protein ACODAJ_11055 [Planctomycetota bacterium]